MFRKFLFILTLITLITTRLPHFSFPAQAAPSLVASQPMTLPVTVKEEEAAPAPVTELVTKPEPVQAVVTKPTTDNSGLRPSPIIQSDMTVAARPPDHITTRLPIIEYHYSTFNMGTGVRMETDWFLSQLAWLHANDFQALTSDQLTGFVKGTYNPPQRSVVLTFDVGASKFDDYTNIVIPALRQYHLHAIFFILASRTVDSCDDPDQACWPMLKQWADEGIISVGSHSWSHIDYQTMTPEDIYRDAAHSKALVEEKTGHVVQGICYPFDSVNPAAFDLLKSLGYTFAVGGYTQADRSVHASADQPYNLPRYYPYSGEDYYPIIGGTHGQTFDQMLLSSIDQ